MQLLLARLLFGFDIEATPKIQGWLKQNVYLLWNKPALWIRLVPREVKFRKQVDDMPSLAAFDKLYS